MIAPGGFPQVVPQSHVGRTMSRKKGTRVGKTRTSSGVEIPWCQGRCELSPEREGRLWELSEWERAPASEGESQEMRLGTGTPSARLPWAFL